MMATQPQNGTAGRLRLSARPVMPITEPIDFERDGQAVVLRGFVNGPGCPGYVAGAFENARARYDEAVWTKDEENRDVYRPDDVAWRAFIRDALLAVVDGLDMLEAEMLSGGEAQQPGLTATPSEASALLRALGWLRPIETPPEPLPKEAAPATEQPVPRSTRKSRRSTASDQANS